MGPFYCPTDQSIYIDPSFFNELSHAASRRRAISPRPMSSRMRSATTSRTSKARSTARRRRRRGAGTAAGNAIQVGVELQADCYAGVWAANAKTPGPSMLEAGDIEEGMRAAEAIGDDTLQKQAQGRSSPESFTHGTSAQRMEALRRGLTHAATRRSAITRADSAALELDQHLAGVGAAEQAEEGVGHGFEPVDHRVARLDLARGDPARPCRGRIRRARGR